MKRFSAAVKSLMVFALVLISQLAWAISQEMQDLVTFETKANAVATRSNKRVMLEHYEIPLELVESDIADRTNPAYLKALIVKRGDRKFLRWIINPEDTKWHKKVRTFLIKNHINPTKVTYFEGYMTASRSYIVVDPKTGAEFSFKGSTNHTGGAWRDKKQTWDDAKQIRMMTDFVDQQLKKKPVLENTILLDEPLAFGIKKLDQGMVIRSYEELPKSEKRYVPGFAIMHDQLGRALALANGSKDPAAYWNEHYNKPLARALAEFFVLTGMWYDSPHSQNFLVELDANDRPTGKIVLRDFGDTYLSKEFFTAAHRTDILKKWDKENIKKAKMSISVGILHGNYPPRWMDINSDTKLPGSYDQWGRDFFAEVKKEFQHQTGLELTLGLEKPNRSDIIDPNDAKIVIGKSNYIQQYFSMSNETGKKFIELVKKGLNRDHLMIRSCSRVLMAM